MLTRDLQELLLWSFGIGGVIAIVYLLFLWILRLRGVFVTRTKFGVTMVFDSVDADKTPVRLLNVNGTYQSVSYVPKDLRAELAVEYHRLMADLIEQATATPQPTPKKREEPRARVLILGGGGFSLPKYLIAHKCALAGKKPLGPMKTAEGAQLVHDRLCKGGLYLADIRCPLEGSQSAPLTEVVEKFGHIFAHVAYVPEWPDTPKTAGNNVLIVTDVKYSYPEGTIVIK